MNLILTTKAWYCRIEVELVCEMKHSSLVRYKGRSFVVDTSDLVLERTVKETVKEVQKSRAA